MGAVVFGQLYKKCAADDESQQREKEKEGWNTARTYSVGSTL